MTEEVKKPRPRCFDEGYDKQKRSKKHETRIAKAFGGRRLPRSGGLPWSKWDKTSAGGDATTRSLHIEHKRTDKASISVKRDWLDKVSDAARRRAKDPALVVTFEKANSPPEDWVLIPMSLARRVLGVGEDG